MLRGVSYIPSNHLFARLKGPDVLAYFHAEATVSVQAHFLPLTLPHSVVSFFEGIEQKFIHHEGAQWIQITA